MTFVLGANYTTLELRMVSRDEVDLSRKIHHRRNEGSFLVMKLVLEVFGVKTPLSPSLGVRTYPRVNFRVNIHPDRPMEKNRGLFITA
jgi:hypothetical protein